MKVLVIGRDPNLFKENSDMFRRASEYAKLFEEYHVISMSETGFKKGDYGSLKIYPTNSWLVFLRPLDAIKIGIKVVRENKIDMIDAQDPGEAGLVAYILSILSGKPWRLQIHTDIFSPWYQKASWKEMVRFVLASFLVKRASVIRAVSQRIKESLVKKFTLSPAKIFVLPMFTELNKFFEAIPDQKDTERFMKYEFKMIAVGRFVEKEKNFSMLIGMMREFIKICPKSLLIIVGEGPDGVNYKSQIKEYNLGENVIIEGWREDLPSFYKNFDLYLSSSNYEGWGRTIIEAMASNLPVVMTDTGLAGEVLKDGETGRVVPVEDEGKFLDAVKDLYKNPDERDRLARAVGQKIKGMYPANKEEYLTLYKKSFSI